MANKLSDEWTPWLELNRLSPLKSLFELFGDAVETLASQYRHNIHISVSLCIPFPPLKTALWCAIILNNRPKPTEDATCYHGNDYDGFVDRQSR